MLRKKLFERTTQEKRSLDPEDQKVDLLDLSLQNCPPGDISKYFPNVQHEPTNYFANNLLEIQWNLNNRLNQVNFLRPPIEYVYNPTEYAKIPNELYFKKYCQSKKILLFVGMNPGPFGMCQTGVPFGDTNWVKNWLHIQGPVLKPFIECPSRLIQGFNCTRKEQSGDRFWKFWSDVCGTPEIFFKNAFVYNYCPLAFMDGSGRNLTPAEIKDSKQLESICDKFYLDVINLMKPDILIAIGRYIEKRSLTLSKHTNLNIPILCMPHPSPRTVNNHNWPDKAKVFLERHNLLQFFE